VPEMESMEVCALCGKEGKLVIHHIRYDPVKTIKICHSCHRKIHGRGVFIELSDGTLVALTKGRKSSSYRIIIPPSLVKEAGLSTDGKRDYFLIVWDSRVPDLIILKPVNIEDVLTRAARSMKSSAKVILGGE